MTEAYVVVGLAIWSVAGIYLMHRLVTYGRRYHKPDPSNTVAAVTAILCGPFMWVIALFAILGVLADRFAKWFFHRKETDGQSH